MSGYIKDAIRTESIDGANARLMKARSFLGLLKMNLDFIEGQADDFKKFVYYGRETEAFKVYGLIGEADMAPENLSEEDIRLLHAGLGILTEAAEFLSPIIAKISGQTNQLDTVNLKEEIGDLMWYLAIACDTLNTTFEKEQDRNIKKLKLRYPEKFDSDKAINRDVEKERELLEDEEPDVDNRIILEARITGNPEFMVSDYILTCLMDDKQFETIEFFSGGAGFDLNIFNGKTLEEAKVHIVNNLQGRIVE